MNTSLCLAAPWSENDIFLLKRNVFMFTFTQTLYYADKVYVLITEQKAEQAVKLQLTYC